MKHNTLIYYENLSDYYLNRLLGLVKPMLKEYPHDNGFYIMYEKALIELTVRELEKEDLKR